MTNMYSKKWEKTVKLAQKLSDKNISTVLYVENEYLPYLCYLQG